MELILISDTKLKIMLSESDMKEYNIGKEADCAESNTRHAIRSLLDRVKDITGFDTDGEEIFIQLYTSKGGGCELFITKCREEVSAASQKERLEKAKSPETKKEFSKAQKHSLENTDGKRSPAKISTDQKNAFCGGIEKDSELSCKYSDKKSSKQYTSGRISYSFPSLRELCKVCRVLSDSKIHINSMAFGDDRGKYYLLLNDPSLSAYSRLDKLTFILEYGERENPDALLSYIFEHGVSICSENAIEILGEY